MLLDAGVETRGKHVVIVGRSDIVGKPLALLLASRGPGGDATVSIEDLLGVIAAWGTDGDGAEIASPYDLTDISDLLGVVAAFGNCP